MARPPVDYQISIIEDDGGDTFTGQMTTFDDNLIYEDISTYAGVGTVWGVLPIERCEALASVHKIYRAVYGALTARVQRV